MEENVDSRINESGSETVSSDAIRENIDFSVESENNIAIGQESNGNSEEINVLDLVDGYNKMKKEKVKLISIVVNQSHHIQKLKYKLQGKEKDNIDWMQLFSETNRKTLRHVPSDAKSDKRFIRRLLEILYETNITALNTCCVKGRPEYIGANGKNIPENTPISPEKYKILQNAFENRVDGDDDRSKKTYFHKVVNKAICEIRDRGSNRKKDVQNR